MKPVLYRSCFLYLYDRTKLFNFERWMSERFEEENAKLIDPSSFSYFPLQFKKRLRLNKNTTQIQFRLYLTIQTILWPSINFINILWATFFVWKCCAKLFCTYSLCLYSSRQKKICPICSLAMINTKFSQSFSCFLSLIWNKLLLLGAIQMIETFFQCEECKKTKEKTSCPL